MGVVVLVHNSQKSVPNGRQHRGIKDFIKLLYTRFRGTKRCPDAPTDTAERKVLASSSAATSPASIPTPERPVSVPADPTALVRSPPALPAKVRMDGVVSTLIFDNCFSPAAEATDDYEHLANGSPSDKADAACSTAFKGKSPIYPSSYRYSLPPSPPASEKESDEGAPQHHKSPPPGPQLTAAVENVDTTSPISPSSSKHSNRLRRELSYTDALTQLATHIDTLTRQSTSLKTSLAKLDGWKRHVRDRPLVSAFADLVAAVHALRTEVEASGILSCTVLSEMERMMLLGLEGVEDAVAEMARTSGMEGAMGELRVRVGRAGAWVGVMRVRVGREAWQGP